MYDLSCWEYGVLQLVSEQVGLSGQVVESVVSSDDYFVVCFVVYLLFLVVEFCMKVRRV